MTSLVSPAPETRVLWGRWGLRAIAGTYLVVMLIVPLAVIVQDGLREGLGGLWRAVTLPIAWSALTLTLWTAAVMAVINGVMGLLTAYVLVRYNFPGKGILNAIVDLPLAIPTLVTGVMLVVLYGPQAALGGWFKDALGWRIIFAPPGIILALLFITFPYCGARGSAGADEFRDRARSRRHLGRGRLDDVQPGDFACTDLPVDQWRAIKFCPRHRRVWRDHDCGWQHSVQITDSGSVCVGPGRVGKSARRERRVHGHARHRLWVGRVGQWVAKASNRAG